MTALLNDVTFKRIMEEKPLWVWDDRLKRYRHQNGRIIGVRQMVGLRDQFIAGVKGETDTLTKRLFSKRISIQRWETEARNIIKAAFIDSYVLGRGGRDNMTAADWGRLGSMLRRQYGYLRNFSLDIADGRYTVNQSGMVMARLGLYAEAASQAFERGKTEGRGIPRLEQYPGDGQTQCKTNCKCYLQIKETADAWLITWKLNPAEHCGDCVRLAREWNPLTIPKVA